jgi:hypothetical protein
VRVACDHVVFLGLLFMGHGCFCMLGFRGWRIPKIDLLCCW